MRTHLATVAFAALVLTGCFPFRKKPAAVVPSAPTPVPAAPATTPTNVPEVPPPPAPKPTPTTPKPRPVIPVAPAPAPSAPPAFVEILTPGQQARLIAAYEQSIKSARAAINQILTHRLTPEQSDSVNRLRSFLAQADLAKASDPSTAAQLAHRADLLANTLLHSLQ